LNVQAVFREAIEQDGKFGRSQIFIDVGTESDQLDVAELRTELTESPAKVGIGSIKRLTVIEPIWSYPNRYNANDPLDPTFYKPTSWFVMGKEIHSSRLMTIITRDVPDILKPAYAFAGLSLSQMVKPYVDNWLRTRQSVSDLIHAFTVWTLKTDMSTITTSEGLVNFYNRLQMFNLGRDNHGVNAINKESEEFENVSAPLGSLDKLQAQSQEQMCAPTGLPLVYLTGITPSGLNATSEGEIEVFQDTISANQEIYTPFLSKILNIVQLSLFGKIDPDIGFKWEPLRTMSDEQRANIRKVEADTDAVLIGAGVVTQEEVRERVAGEEDSPYSGLDLSAPLPEVPEPEEGPEARAEKISGTQQPKEEEAEV
jgi:phage-related protein (TIGR01555 family)